VGVFWAVVAILAVSLISGAVIGAVVYWVIVREVNSGS
jgi:hypothetical protein